MGDDEYHPISGKGTNLTGAGGIGYTVVDYIDTMLIMGLRGEYDRARSWVANKMTFDRDRILIPLRCVSRGYHRTQAESVVKTTIRVLGLLSAYHLSGEDLLYLEKAKELGDRILLTFDTPSG